MKRWFGPKWIGWGASPASWEGFLATGLLIAGVVALAPSGLGEARVVAGTGAMVGLYMLVIALTYAPDESPRKTAGLSLASVWIVYLVTMIGVSTWGGAFLAGRDLPVWWGRDGSAEAFAPAAQVLTAVPVAAAFAVAIISIASGGGRARGAAMTASILLLSAVLLLQLAYVAAQVGVLT